MTPRLKLAFLASRNGSAFRAAVEAAFVREAAVLTRLRHRNVVHVYGVVPGADGHPKWIAMERAELDLQGLLVSLGVGGLPYDRMLPLLQDVLEGLVFLHGARDDAGRPDPIVHFDVKPKNVLVFQDPRR